MRGSRSAPETRATLIAVPDDATNRVLYAQLWDGESTAAVMTALREVFTTYGLPMALYSDRAGWAFHTAEGEGAGGQDASDAGGARADAAWASSTSRRIRRKPAAAVSGSIGRSRTGSSMSSAWRASRRSPPPTPICATSSCPRHNATFSHPPAGPGVGVGRPRRRRLRPDSLSSGDADGGRGQRRHDGRHAPCRSSKQPGRRTCAGLEVVVRRHLDGRYSIWRGPQRLGLFEATGRPVDAAAPVDGRTSRPPTSRLDRPRKAAAGPQRPQAVTATL